MQNMMKENPALKSLDWKKSKSILEKDTKNVQMYLILTKN